MSRPAISRRRKSRRAIRTWASSRWKWRVPTSQSPTAAILPTPICALRRKACTSFATSPPDKPRHGYVIVQGSSSTVNLVKVLPKLEAAGVNVKVIAAISEDLFDRQPQAYRDSVLPPEARYDLMVVSTGTRRMWPLRNLGPLTDEYSLTSDFDNAGEPAASKRKSSRKHTSIPTRFSPASSVSRTNANAASAISAR